MAEVTIVGKLIEPGAQRDAIHVAVAPVIAGERLAPGQHVGLASADQEIVMAARDHIGIIDPFLPGAVMKGERCWLFLYPQSITSLRHNWTHPAFGQAQPADEKAASEAWLREYAIRMNCYEEPGEAYQKLLNGLRTRELYAHGTDLHGLWNLDDADDLRHHAEIVTGEKIDWNRFTFSCSC